MIKKDRFKFFGCNDIFSFEKKIGFFKKIFTFLFRIKVEGLENFENAGKRVLIIPNHTSYLDGFLMALFIRKKVTFSITENLSHKWWMKIFTLLTETKFLDPTNPNSIRSMINELKQNKPCVLFVGSNLFGATTQMNIYESPVIIAEKAKAKILPVQIIGLKDSAYSRIKPKFRFKLFPKITIKFKPAIQLFDDNINKQNETITFKEARKKFSAKLYDLLMSLRFESNNYQTDIISVIINSMKLVGGKKEILEDVNRTPMKFRELFMKSFIVGRFLNKKAKKDEVVGVLVPTSSAAVVSFMGLSLYGKIPAMINFTTAPLQVVSACKTAGVKKIVTAHKVVEGAKLEPLIETLNTENIEVIYLEDMKTKLTILDKLTGIIGCLFPKTMYSITNKGSDPEDPAVIIFTSGSEGAPKAVALSHKNLLANVYQTVTKFDVIKRDIIFNCLPMFHSFGMTGGTIMPLVCGIKVFAYPSPLHYKIIPGLCSASKATVIFSTETFLLNYAKYANSYDFNSIRIAAVGAERITKSTKELWLNKFGVRLMEGYGATECSPFLSINNFLFYKDNSVGKFMPNIEYKLKPIDGITDGAELLVKGPNIMRGYLDGHGGIKEQDDWYATGDIVNIDDEGFIFIKGRFKRFAKIGAEMVSLLAVENVIKVKYPEYSYATTSIPDPKKGEQIILLTDNKNLDREKLLEIFDGKAITTLAIPKEIIYMNELPLLNTGKTNYVKAQEIAMEKFGNK